ncbi:MAG: hypothetical protein LBD84_05120 [Campylobacteraceae bacterium]|nr:hypothetical protein [Campylobacteraceae bacterium]
MAPRLVRQTALTCRGDIATRIAVEAATNLTCNINNRVILPESGLGFSSNRPYM